MNTSVKVSICIPTYNNVREVERLLKSVYEQEYRDFEVNISDDSTNDEIAGLVMGYPEVNYVHNVMPYGHIFNWNAAIRMASGTYIKIMFSDDWFTEPTSLGDFVELLDSNPQASLAFSGSRQVMLDDGMKHYDRCAQDAFIGGLHKDYRNLFMGNQIGAPSAVLYRRGSELTLFDEKSNWASDMFLYFSLLQKNAVFAYTKKPLVSIGVHDHQYTESFSERDIRIYNDYKYMYEKYRLWEYDACREYFAEKFIVKYHKGLKEAAELKISRVMCMRKYAKDFVQSVRCFVNHRICPKN